MNSKIAANFKKIHEVVLAVLYCSPTVIPCKNYTYRYASIQQNNMTNFGSRNALDFGNGALRGNFFFGVFYDESLYLIRRKALVSFMKTN